MKSLVVSFALFALAVAAPRQEKRSLGHVVAYSVPAAVSHSSRLDVHSSPALVAPVEVAPVFARTLVSPVYAGSAVSHQSRVDVKSSPAVVETVVSPVEVAPVVAEPVVAARAVVSPVYAGSAVSHQSRVDVKSSPAVVQTVVAPAVPEPYVVDARSVYSVPSAVYSVPAATVYSGGAAVTHQSRVDVQSSPAVVSEHVVAPAVVGARSVVVPSVYSTW